ncbi:MAG TPA: glycosyltransferase family 4 protein [Candidatus Acidoferrum sp.]|nr:glycosyltransferase family 4 protein [Candidatus Acidoferrum sp.]
MRILCLTPWFPAWPGAQSGNFILDSVAALHAQGHQVKVLVARAWHPAWAGWLHDDWGRPRLQPELHDSELGVEAVTYLSIPRNLLRALSWRWFHARVQPALRATVARFKPDVILAHTELMGAAAVAVGKASGLPSVVVLHGINPDPRLDTAAERQRLRETLDAATRVVLVGEPLRQYFAARSGHHDHFRIVHNGFVPPSRVRSAEPCPTTLRLISVSNLHAGKGIDLTLRALAQLHRQGNAAWHYTVVGDGAERTPLQALTAELGLSAQVTFVGAIDHAAVYDRLCQADVFVLPSWREAFGIAWLEAMACGLLAIGVRDQGPSAFIRDGDTGLLVQPQDVEDLAQCLQRIFSTPAAMQQLARRGQALVTREFTWAAHAGKLAAVCDEARSAR